MVTRNKAASIALLVLTTFALASGIAKAESPWPMYFHDAQHTSCSLYSGPETNDVRWVFTLPSNALVNTGIVVDSEGAIYIGVGEPANWTTNVYAIRADGTLKWNSTIGVGDFVFFLGDMAFGRDSRKPRWWAEQLNGQKIYIKGSHDKGVRPMSIIPTVLCVTLAAILRTDFGDYYLTHQPRGNYTNHGFIVPSDWKGWVVHGHNHNNRPYLDIRRKEVNVSVEVIGYNPISVYQLVKDTSNLVN